MPDTRYFTLYIWAVALLLSESHAIINDLDVILHGFMLQYTIMALEEVNNFG
jgi:hypothetical protein